MSIENQITYLENAMQKAKLINLDKPILQSNLTNQVVYEPDDLFYKGSLVLSQEIFNLKRLKIKLEDEQFNYKVVLDKPLYSSVKKIPNFGNFIIGLMLGLFLSLGFIFFKSILKNNE